MIASEQDKEREGDADAVGLDARTGQQQATGAKAKATHGLANDTRSDNAAFVAAIGANDIAAMARAVLEEGVSVIAVLGDGSTPLHFAAQLGQVASLKWLVGQGADIHAKSVDGMTVLDFAAYQGQVASMEWLVRQGADVHAKDEKNGRTALHLAAQQGQVVSLEWLAGQSANIHANDKTGMTPLHVAAQEGQIASLEWLVGHGADVHAKIETGMTVLHFAAQQGQVASMEWLVGQGADVHAKDQTGHTMFHFAAQQGQVASMKWLVWQGADVHAKSKNGMTALHVAAQQVHMAAMEWLVGQGADVHAKDKTGHTMLHFAALQGQVASLEWLVGQGADVHTRSKNGNTALHEAACSGQVVSMEFLARQGVDIHAKNKDGHTALHLAEQDGQVLAIAWLRGQGVLASTAEPTPAETVAPEILSLPPTIAVVGVDEGYSGLYKKQQRTDGRVLYKSTRANSKQAIWYDTDEYGGKWRIGEVGSDGMYGSTSWFAVAMDSAISPLNIEATWHELAWEPCSSIRVTKSKKKHTKVIEVKGVPNACGGLLCHGVLVNGKYRPQAQFIDGRPTYKGGPDRDQVIWYSASTGSWRVGPVIFAGTSRCFMHTKDTAATPNTVKTPWCVSTEYSLPNPCANVILPSVKVAEQEVPQQMQLKIPKAMASERKRCLGCGHQYTLQVEVVFHEECLHHHCLSCRNELNGPACAVCAEAMIGDYLGNGEREDA
jgi:ankyrin repeat protein